MYTTPILEEKYRVQAKLSKAAGGSVKRYAQQTHEAVLKLQEEYGIKLKYVSPPRRLPTPDGEQMSG